MYQNMYKLGMSFNPKRKRFYKKRISVKKPTFQEYSISELKAFVRIDPDNQQASQELQRRS